MAHDNPMITPLLGFLVGLGSGLLLGGILVYLQMSKKNRSVDRFSSEEGASNDETTSPGSSVDFMRQVSQQVALMAQTKQGFDVPQRIEASLDLPEWCKEMAKVHQTAIVSLKSQPQIPDIIAIVPRNPPDPGK
ncbi:MAG: hypothetical protein ACKN9W_20415 [Methylococcus sp.]